MIDVSIFLDMGLVILMSTVSIVIPLLVKKANDWFGLEVDKKHREALQGTLVLAINSAMTNVRNKQSGKLFVGDKGTIFYSVGNYLSKTVPDALKRFKIDPYSFEGQQRLQLMVEARMAGLVFDEKEDNVVQMKSVAPPKEKK